MEGFNNNYISNTKTKEMLGLNELGLTRDQIRVIMGSLDISREYRGCKYYYNIDEVNSVIRNVRDFFKNVYTQEEIEYLKIQNFKEVELAKVTIPKGYNSVLYKERYPNKSYKRRTICYLKDKLKNMEEAIKYTNLYKSEITNWKDDNIKYIPLKEVLEMSNFTENCFLTVIKNNYDINNITILTGQLLYLKEDIRKIVEEQQEFLSNYATLKQVKDRYFNGGCPKRLKTLKKYKQPLCAITKDNSLYGYFLKISEVEELVKYLDKIVKYREIICESPYETFQAKLLNYNGWTGFEQNSIYTQSKWFQFIKQKLARMNCKEKVLNYKINKLVIYTLELKNMLEINMKSEVYLLTANEINMYFRSSKIGSNKILYKFLKEVYADIVISKNINEKCFKISSINEPPRKYAKLEGEDNQNSNNSIYDFTVYSEVFKYEINSDLHIKKALEEIKKHKTATYASTWLYTMLHLNNAWRNGDVIDFPRLDIEDLLSNNNIENLDWFEVKKIDLPFARAIINRIIKWEFRISKTQIKGHFFCSDELAPSLVTSIIILTLYNNNNVLNDSNVLMSFNRKFNQITKSQLQYFFKEFHIKDFEFLSKKFNKSIMTYITYLVSTSNEVRSLEYAQALRGHKDIGSTLYYINLDYESVQETSEMLFARGEFGYITSLLLQKLKSGASKNFREITEETTIVNTFYGNEIKINATIGFLNSIRSDRENLIKLVNSMSLKECQKKLTDIFLRNLPCKDSSDMQCLLSKRKCQRIDLSNCFECTYHIPTIYVLSSVCESIKDDLHNFGGTENKVKKFRLAVKISRKKIVLIEAVRAFGKDYVYGCLGMERDSFLDSIAEVEDYLLSY
jgi:hypothetical protein